MAQVQDEQADDGLFYLHYLEVSDFKAIIKQQSNPKTYDPYLILPKWAYSTATVDDDQFKTQMPTTVTVDDKSKTQIPAKGFVLPPASVPLDRRVMVARGSLVSKPKALVDLMLSHNQYVDDYYDALRMRDPQVEAMYRRRRQQWKEWYRRRRKWLGLPDDPFDSDVEQAEDGINEETALVTTVQNPTPEQRLAQLVSRQLAQQHHDYLERKKHSDDQCVTHDGWPCMYNTEWEWCPDSNGTGQLSHLAIKYHCVRVSS